MVGERSDAWSVEKVSSWINKYKDSPAQLKVDGKPFVSTFEGPQWSDNWAAVRSSVEGDIYLVPDFSSVGVPGIKDQGKLDQIDGSCKL
jgi:glucan endo-1,3-alpha-glucosidase